MDGAASGKGEPLRRALSSKLGLVPLPAMLFLIPLVPSVAEMRKAKPDWGLILVPMLGSYLIFTVILVVIGTGASMPNMRRIVFYAANGEWPRVRLFFTKGFPLLPSVYAHPVAAALRNRAAGDGAATAPTEYDAFFQEGPDGGWRLGEAGAAEMIRRLEADFAPRGFLRRCSAFFVFILKYLPYILGAGLALKVLALLMSVLWDALHRAR